MQHADFTRIARILLADFYAECFVESIRNPCEIHVESKRNLSMPNP